MASQRTWDQLGELKDMAGKMQDPNALKDQAVQQAVNHFAGKEEQLQKAMETMAKYKQKYGSLESLSDIPKRRPNEMRDKPLRERLLLT